MRLQKPIVLQRTGLPESSFARRPIAGGWGRRRGDFAGFGRVRFDAPLGGYKRGAELRRWRFPGSKKITFFHMQIAGVLDGVDYFKLSKTRGDANAETIAGGWQRQTR